MTTYDTLKIRADGLRKRIQPFLADGKSTRKEAAQKILADLEIILTVDIPALTKVRDVDDRTEWVVNIIQELDGYEETIADFERDVAKKQDRTDIALPSTQAEAAVEFAAELSEKDTTLAAIFINMTAPKVGKRRPTSVLADELGVTFRTVRKWERRFLRLCEDRKWEVVEKDKHARATERGWDWERRYAELLERSQAKTAAEFAALLNEIDPILESIFINITIPEGGERESLDVLMSKFDIARPTIVRWEKKFAELCQEKGWKIDEGSERSRKIRRGTDLVKRYHEFLRASVARTEEEFAHELDGLNTGLAIIFRNTMTSNSHQKVSQQSLATKTDMSRSAVRGWMRRFNDLRKEKGWNEAK